ncbi:MAG: adenosylcobinamide kinase / adenosylcobinamide-phosphate guanylyltransferase, partial [Actinomycetota bacterium]|nr:adenosylcobinamide kinase / adenosylcobinamide-phosphate guanylyltransferase [Actinomycetota bacterium]
MRVQLLGTAAAGGWPNPFCECASCSTLRRAGETRGQTAALVDDVLMLDCGPDAGRTATRLGRSLSAVRHLLVTHAHHDHLEPAALLWRSWAERSEPLDLVGPPEVVDTVRDWLAPSDPVRLRPVQPGDELRLGG